jgi:bacterioferritin
VTEGYRADRSAVIKILNDALATEIVCVLRYKRHYYGFRAFTPRASRGGIPRARQRKTEGHADQLAMRIVQLGGAPDLSRTLCWRAATPTTSRARTSSRCSKT